MRKDTDAQPTLSVRGALFALSLLCAAPACAHATPGSKIVSADLAITAGSDVMRRLYVYLPPGYDGDAQGPSYPYLILLHGSPGSAGDWLNMGGAQGILDDRILAGKLEPLVVAFPEGNGGFLRDSQYVNSADGKEPVEDFVSVVVPRYLREHYRTVRDPAHAAIGGLSAGGFGALNIGLKHQDVFGSVISFSGYGLIDQNPMSGPFIRGSESLIAENSPLLYIPTLPRTSPKVLLIVGSKDSLLAENQELYAALKTRGFQVQMLTFEGTHTWGFWKAHLADGLAWLDARLRP